MPDLTHLNNLRKLVLIDQCKPSSSIKEIPSPTLPDTTTLTHLTLGKGYISELKNLPHSLKYLSINSGSMLNPPSLPPNLEHFTCFNHGKIPTFPLSLKKFTCKYYELNLENYKPLLTMLKIESISNEHFLLLKSYFKTIEVKGSRYYIDIQSIPHTTKELSVNIEIYSSPILPPHLTTLVFYPNYSEKICSLPPTLTHLTLG